MGRHGKIYKDIDHMIKEHGHDTQTLIKNARTTLHAYRQLNWQHSTIIQNNQTHSMTATLEEARCGLIVFDRLEKNSQDHLAQTITRSGNHFAVRIMNQVLAMVGCYPARGALYYDILRQSYFEGITDDSLMEKHHLERSIYYDRKREATALYGYTLYCIVLPDIQAMLA